MFCPLCLYPQYCPCDSCITRNPLGFKTWIWHKGDFVICGNCGFYANCDDWLDIECEQVQIMNNLAEQIGDIK